MDFELMLRQIRENPNTPSNWQVYDQNAGELRIIAIQVIYNYIKDTAKGEFKNYLQEYSEHLANFAVTEFPQKVIDSNIKPVAGYIAGVLRRTAIWQGRTDSTKIFIRKKNEVSLDTPPSEDDTDSGISLAEKILKKAESIFMESTGPGAALIDKYIYTNPIFDENSCCLCLFETLSTNEGWNKSQLSFISLKKNCGEICDIETPYLIRQRIQACYDEFKNKVDIDLTDFI